MAALPLITPLSPYYVYSSCQFHRSFSLFFRRILLDTGDGLQPEYISNLLESLSFNKITIKEIILSHWHHDHVGGTLEILKNAEVTTEMMKSS